MKMNDVTYGAPENFLSGLGQYSYEDMLMDAALGLAAASDDDILMGLHGLGRWGRKGAPQPFNLFNQLTNKKLAEVLKQTPGNAQAVAEAIRRAPASARRDFIKKANLTKREAQAFIKNPAAFVQKAGAGVFTSLPKFPKRIGPFKLGDMHELGDMNEDYALDGLGRMGRREFTTMRPVGPPPRPPPGKPVSVMDAIIKNAKEMNAKKAIVAQVQKRAAAQNPIVAIALAKKQRQTSMPGASETRGIIAATNMAARKAMLAKKDEQAARQLLAQSDKRGAAAKAVAALTKAREAAIMANKAEKTRLARGLDLLSNTLNAQANYLDGLIKAEVARSGQSARTMALAATAQTLRQQVKRIKAQSGVVAAMPNIPLNAPKQQRIAELANKFNIRTAKKDKFMLDKATIAVLGDLAEDPMAQVTDYEGALSYYGVDGLGKLMADMEFSNYDEAVDGLSEMMGGIGYTDTTPILAQSDEVLAQATTLATTAYNEVIVPASGLGQLPDFGKMFADVGKTIGDATKFVSDAGKAVGSAVGTVKNLANQGGKLVQQVTGQKPKPPPSQTKPPVQIPVPAAVVQQTPVQAAVMQTPSVGQSQAAITAAPTAESISTEKKADDKGIPVYVYAAGGVALLGAVYFFFLRSNPAPAPAAA